MVSVYSSTKHGNYSSQVGCYLPQMLIFPSQCSFVLVENEFCFWAKDFFIACTMAKNMTDFHLIVFVRFSTSRASKKTPNSFAIQSGALKARLARRLGTYSSPSVAASSADVYNPSLQRHSNRPVSHFITTELLPFVCGTSQSGRIHDCIVINGPCEHSENMMDDLKPHINDGHTCLDLVPYN